MSALRMHILPPSSYVCEDYPCNYVAEPSLNYICKFFISNHQSIQNGSEMLVKTSHYVFLNLCVNSLMGGTSQVLLSSKHGLFLSATWSIT